MAEEISQEIGFLPRAEELLRPALELCAAGQMPLKELVDALAVQHQLSAEQLRLSSKSGDPVFAKRARWALTHLVQAGLLKRPREATYAITDRGILFLEREAFVTYTLLRQFPEYVAFENRTRTTLQSRDGLEITESSDFSGITPTMSVSSDVEEEEESPSDRDIGEPYDPKAIRVDPRVYSVRQVLDMIDEEELDLAPDFQRLSVWKGWQRSQLIESLLLRIPLPTFYFSSDSEGLLQVVDGVQRLTTIHDFVRRENFRLTDLEYLSETVGGKSFTDLKDTIWSRRILGTQINAFVIDPQTPIRVKFDIFRRLNTGGSPLNSQEIRHCMSKPRSRNFLRDLASIEEFHEATGFTFRNHVRMVDRELALRFTAFYLLDDIQEYERFGAMDDFLTTTSAELDSPSRISDDRIQRVYGAFRLAMLNCQRVFDSHAFRKWPLGSDAMSPVNRALFDVWAVGLSRFDPHEVVRFASRLTELAREAMTTNEAFIDAISTSTGTPRKVVTRFRIVEDLIAQASK